MLQTLNLIQNAFSIRLQKHGFNIFKALPVDLLHEFELGIWKAVLIHLMRILEAMDSKKLHIMNKR
jgi:hypothetical protein